MNRNVFSLFKNCCWIIFLFSASHVVAKDLIKIEGSSTVYPITKQSAQQYALADRGRTQVVIGITGTGGGFRKFCRGRTDISNASRPIKPNEIELCKVNGIEFLELPIALDAITVVVNKNNHWIDSMPISKLAYIWQASSEAQLDLWSEVDTAYPSNPITLHGPGSDSGTYDYFVNVVLNKTNSRQDYFANEDDNAMAAEVAADKYAMAFLGFAYYQQHQDMLKAIAITNTNGKPTLPSVENVINGEYSDLSRPLFLYVNKAAISKRESVRKFLTHAFHPRNVKRSVNNSGYIPLPEKMYKQARNIISQEITGSHFNSDDMVTNFTQFLESD
ncbi:protein sphX [Vibrio tubiashii]|nr:protein sphX [Vibrio tubiashii]